MFKAAIFDLDGTLLDSMSVWSSLCPEFLKRHNVDSDIDLDSKIGVVSLREALAYLIKEFDLDVQLEDAWIETWQIVEDFYRNKAQVKAGIVKILDHLYKYHIPCGVITATETGLVVPALERAGLRRYFKEIYSCAEMQTSKRSSEVFVKMSSSFGAKPWETIVFEDALYAALTAKNAGYAVAAIYDASEKNPLKLKDTADWYCRSWEEFSLDWL